MTRREREKRRERSREGRKTHQGYSLNDRQFLASGAPVGEEEDHVEVDLNDCEEGGSKGGRSGRNEGRSTEFEGRVTIRVLSKFQGCLWATKGTGRRETVSR
jgi:hypothetical protein